MKRKACIVKRDALLQSVRITSGHKLNECSYNVTHPGGLLLFVARVDGFRRRCSIIASLAHCPTNKSDNAFRSALEIFCRGQESLQRSLGKCCSSVPERNKPVKYLSRQLGWTGSRPKHRRTVVVKLAH